MKESKNIWYNAGIHIVVWLGYAMIMFYWLSFPFESQAAALFTIRIVLLDAFLFYFNTFLLLPRLVGHSRYTWYGIAVLLLVAGTYFVVALSDGMLFQNIWMNSRFHIHPFSFNRHTIYRRILPHLLSSLAILFISTVYWVISENRKKKQWEMSLLNENLQTEMKFLKSQINPHFLFNALNNIYSLSNSRSERAPEMILKLSEMLRYMLYESNEKKVPLRKEMSYILNYIDFQCLKIEEEPNVRIDFQNADTTLPVEPMLFIPFIENSFKHSNIDDVPHGCIAMTITTEDSKVRFRIENSIPRQPYSKDGSGGIGLQNVRKRLELLYPGKHRLRIEEKNDLFLVDLEIETL